MNIFQINYWLLEQINLLIEATPEQLKQKYPKYASIIEKLQKHKVHIGKFFPYVLKKIEKGENKDLIVELIIKFSNFSSRGKFKKAFKSDLISKKEFDILYWTKKEVKEFKDFIEGFEKYELKSLKEKKARHKQADLIGKVKRFSIYMPQDSKSCRTIAPDTKWCIARKKRGQKYFDDTIEKGEIPFFIIDEFSDTRTNDMAKVGFSYNINYYSGHKYFNAKDVSLSQSDLIKYYGELWNKIELIISEKVSKVKGTVQKRIERIKKEKEERRKKIESTREENEALAGDVVIVADYADEEIADTGVSNLLHSMEQEGELDSTLSDRDYNHIASEVIYKVTQLIGNLVGTITEPLRCMLHEIDYYDLEIDWNIDELRPEEYLDKEPPKEPKNPSKDEKKQYKKDKEIYDISDYIINNIIEQGPDIAGFYIHPQHLKIIDKVTYDEALEFHGGE